MFARGLGLNTMQTIGIMCSDSSDPYLANAIYYLERALRSYEYDSILCCTGYDPVSYTHLVATAHSPMGLAGTAVTNWVSCP